MIEIRRRLRRCTRARVRARRNGTMPRYLTCQCEFYFRFRIGGDRVGLGPLYQNNQHVLRYKLTLLS